jgi:hypothetical protein
MRDGLALPFAYRFLSFDAIPKIAMAGITDPSKNPGLTEGANGHENYKENGYQET